MCCSKINDCCTLIGVHHFTCFPWMKNLINFKIINSNWIMNDLDKWNHMNCALESIMIMKRNIWYFFIHSLGQIENSFISSNYLELQWDSSNRGTFMALAVLQRLLFFKQNLRNPVICISSLVLWWDIVIRDSLQLNLNIASTHQVKRTRSSIN